MAEIPGINEQARQRPVYVNQAAEMAKGLGVTEKAQTLVKEVAGLLGSERSVRVTNAASTQTAEVGTPTGATGVPTLDNPDDAKAKEVDLEKLIAYLQLENDEKQAQMARERIEVQKDNLESQHNAQMEKIQKSLDEMDKAAKTSLLSRIFGWLMAALAVVVAVVACVATGGVAVGAVVGAVIAVGSMILNETGAMEKITQGLSDLLQSMGMSKMAADIVASVGLTVALMAASLGSSALSLGTSAANATLRLVQTGLTVANTVIGVGSTITGGIGAVNNYNAGMASAELTETEKFLAQLRQQLEESQEELQAILEQLQNGYQDVLAILNSETDTQKAIAQQLGAMA